MHDSVRIPATVRSKLHGLKKRQIRSLNRSRRAGTTTGSGVAKVVTSVLAAPAHFSIINNPDEAISYVKMVGSRLKHANVRVVLKDVTEITPDALIALVTHRNRRPHLLSGNLPELASARTVVETCGFSDLVHGVNARGREGRAGFAQTTFASARRGATADTTLARDIVSQACSLAGIAYHPVSYSNLIECMTNTNNHAGRPGEVSWRLMVAFDAPQKVLRFIFIDPGEGICRTTRLRLPIKLGTDANLLASLMDPQVNIFRKLLAGLPKKTRTTSPGRGRGLRKLAESVERGKMRRLVVVTNAAYLERTPLGTTTKTLTGSGLLGTLLYWELATM